MATYVLNGFSVTDSNNDGNPEYVGATELTIVISDEGLFQYEYSDDTNNPGFRTLDLNGTVIPEAFFPENTPDAIPPDTNSALNLSPYGQADNDEAYFFQISYLDGSGVEQTLVMLSIYEESADTDHLFVLSSTDPGLAIPTDQAELNAFFIDAIVNATSIGAVTDPSFAPGAPVDFTATFGPTLDSVGDDDTWTGSDEGEFFDGGDGADSLDGGAGEDVLVGGAGNDTIEGGAGDDAVLYSLDGGAGPVNVDLGAGTATDSHGNTDSLSGIEQVGGTALNDTLVGDAGDNTLAGGAGDDTLDGAGGIDEADYEFLEQGGVQVDLANETATDSFGNTDTLLNIENVRGSAFDDTIIGDEGDNMLFGQAGNDDLRGGGGNDYFDTSVGTGEADSVDGGAGDDTVRFFANDADVTITTDIATGEATVTDGTDTIFTSGVEILELNDATHVICFAQGTHIATPTGETRVENLRIGDPIVTADGRTVAVKWIGRQAISARFGMAERLQPVRLREGALGAGRPWRDLTLTADHALLLDGLLVNAGALVNGTTIQYLPRDEIGPQFTVYHVETEDHDVILAEGAAAETYVDYVGRQAFDNYAEYVALYGAAEPIDEMAHPRVAVARLLPPALKARLDAAAARTGAAQPRAKAG
jgi:Ca2+-binding RTX toxin-like protein